MTSFFLSILNISFTATVVAVAFILLRFIFKKAPRWLSCLLWAFVGLRLAVPFSVESKFSLIPSTDLFDVVTTAESTDVIKVHTGISAFNSTVNRQLSSLSQPEKALELMDVLAVVWLAVAALEYEPPVPSWIDDGNTYEHIGGIDSVSGNQNNRLYEWDYSGYYPMPIFKTGENL